MPVYLVSLSQKVLYEEFIEAPTEDIAILEAMKLRRKPKQVCAYQFSVDAIEEWNGPDVDFLRATPEVKNHYEETGIWQLGEWADQVQ